MNIKYVEQVVLKEQLQKLGHKLISKDLKFKRSSFVEFICGRCGELVTYQVQLLRKDFKCKKCIEYNGSNFHPKPEQKDGEIGWCVFHPNKTVKEAREYEQLKYSILEERGFEILTVWDYELKNKSKLVKKCLNFLS